MQIYQRFMQLRKYLKMTQSEFGKELGRTKMAISYYEKGERSIDNSIILLLQEKFNVNTDWLKTGEGSMFLEDKQDKIINKVQKKNIINNNIDNNINIPFYTDIEASAGYGAFTGMEIYENVSVSKNIMKVNDNSVIITVTGDSMEPTLYNKDKVIIDTNDKYELKKNKVYVIRKDKEKGLPSKITNTIRYLFRFITAGKISILENKKINEYNLLNHKIQYAYNLDKDETVHLNYDEMLLQGLNWLKEMYERDKKNM